MKLELIDNICFLREGQINSVTEAMDLLAEVWSFEAQKLVIPAVLLSDDFFDLSSGLLGEILQKYTNYHLKVAIVGDFSEYPSQVLPDFIRESNKGQQIFFVESDEEAIGRLND